MFLDGESSSSKLGLLAQPGIARAADWGQGLHCLWGAQYGAAPQSRPQQLVKKPFCLPSTWDCHGESGRWSLALFMLQADAPCSTPLLQTVCPQPLMIPTLASSWHCANLVALGLPCLQRTSGATLGPRVARCSSGADTTSSPHAPSSMPGSCGNGTALTRSYVPIARVPSGCPHCMGTLGAVWCKLEQAAPLKGHWTFLSPWVLYCLQGSQQLHCSHTW